MTVPDNIEGLRSRLSEFFEVLEDTLRNAEARGEQLADHDVVLAIVGQHVGPALDLEMQAAGPSGAATWYLPHLMSVLVEQAGLPRRGSAAAAYQPLLAANKRLKDALNAARRRHENETATEHQNLGDLIRAVPGHVYDQLRPIFAVVETTVQEVPGQVARQLEPSFTALGDSVAAVPEQVSGQLEPSFTALGDSVAAVPEQVSGQLEPSFTALGDSVAAVPEQVSGQLEPSFTALGTAIQGLPAQLAQTLINPIAQAVLAAL